MNQQWMIFRSEATGDHYIYNGELAINFMPVAHKNVWSEDDYDIVHEVYINNRKKLFVNQGVRYIIVSRGTFIEN